MAQSLRSLRPHHSRIPLAQAFRPSWLRYERVTQRVITTRQPASEDINIAVERIMQDLISTETSSQTAMACNQAALFASHTWVLTSSTTARSGTRGRRLPGSRKRSKSWPGPSYQDGTQLADERESLLWGFVNALHAQIQRLDRGIDKIAPQDERPRPREQDGSEIKSLGTGTRHRPSPEPWRSAATPSRPCATSPPRDTVPRPAIPGARVTDRTAARPAN